MRNFILIVFALISQAIFSQTYTINDEGNINACSGTFTIGSHNAGDTFVMTICDDDPDSTHVAVNYSDWSFSGGDVLNVYEGTDVNAPLLGAFDQSNFQVPWAMTASPNNMTGCLTFEFISNGGGSTFSGTIHCQFNCQYFNAVIDSTSEQTDTLYTDICQGETVTFYASGDYNFNGGLYNQSDAQSTFTWDFADGTPAQTGQVVTHTFPNGGGYMIDCIITDQYGCRNTNDVDHRVRVSMTPHWTTSTDTICPDQATTIGATAGQGSAAAHADLWDNTPNMMISGTTFLPDGEGASYSTTLLFDMFGAQTLDSISMLESICANLEHSYIGDLIMKITCPDGTTVILEPQAGASTFLGEPIDDDTILDPGVGYDYCWTPTPQYGTMGDEADALLNGSFGGNNPTLPAGSYTSFESLDNLIGCPLNGQWTITIIDNWASDNGYIFNWGINFAPWVYPDYWFFQNNIVNYDWTGENVVSSQDSMVTVAPSTEGTVCYDVVATDNFGCEYTNQTCIWVLPANDPDCGCVTPPTTIDFSQPLCAGDNVIFTYSGTANISNSTFSWDFDGGTVVSGDILSAGPIEVSFPNNNISYTITLGVQEGNCDPTDTVYTVNMPSELISTISGTDIKCYGDATGTIDLTVSDGTAGYSYNWTTANGSGLVVTDEDQSDLTAGTYDVTVSDANACTITNTYTINGPSQLSLTEASTDILCNGDANGTVTVNATGGTPNYTFDYGNGSQDNGNFTGLAGNTYTVTVTDSNNCVIVSNPIIVSEPEALAVTGISTDILCNGDANGTVTINVTGGTPNYTFDYGSGSQNNGNFTGLSGNTYTVTVTDQNNCVIVNNPLIVNEPPVLEITNEASTDLLCNGDANGTVTVEVTGGTPNYTFDYGNGSQDNGNFTGLSGNTYTVTVTDNNNCVIVSNPITVNEPTALVLTSSSTDILCNGDANGTVTVNATGGTPNYTFDYGNGSQDNGNFTGLAGNTYTVTVTDSNNCVIVSNPLIVEEPTALAISGTSTDLLCNGDANGTVTVEVTGGTPNYTFDYGNGSQNNGNFTGLAGNTYTVTVTDQNNCVIVSSPIVVNEPPALVITNEASTDLLCNGDGNGTITVGVTGGTPNYTFNYGNGNQTNGTFTNLSGGIYTVTITDQNNCIIVSNQLIVNEPPQILSSIPSQFIICKGDSIDIQSIVSGGTSPYTYHWGNTNANTASIHETPLDDIIYNFYVTDANNCASSLSYCQVLVSPDVFLDAYPNIDSVCPGDPVIITAIPSGGDYNYTIIFEGDTIDGTSIVYPNSSDNYTVTVIDGCGMTATAIVPIFVYPLPPIGFYPDITEGCQPLEVSFIETSPNLGQSFLWDFGDGDISNIGTNKNPIHIYETYGDFDVSVTVVSAEGCSNYLELNNLIHVYRLPEAKFTADPDLVSIIRPDIYFQNLSVYGDMYIWDFGDDDSSCVTNPMHTYATNVANYVVTLIAITDKGCTDTVQKIIKVKEEFTLYVPTAFSPDGDNINDFFICKGHGIDLDNFWVGIYDRWGELIWETTDLYEGWNGIAKNHKKVQNGVYKWHVVYKNTDGVEYKKTGNVTVIY